VRSFQKEALAIGDRVELLWFLAGCLSPVLEDAIFRKLARPRRSRHSVARLAQGWITMKIWCNWSANPGARRPWMVCRLTLEGGTESFQPVEISRKRRAKDWLPGARAVLESVP